MTGTTPADAWGGWDFVRREKRRAAPGKKAWAWAVVRCRACGREASFRAPSHARQTGCDGCRRAAPLDAGRRDLAGRHVPLARAVARRYAEKWPREADGVESAAMLGLVDAAGRYDPGAGIPFHRYARRRIEGAVLDALRMTYPHGYRTRAGGRRAGAPVLRQLGAGPGTDRAGDRDPAAPDEAAELADAVDAVEGLARRLPAGRHREVVRLYYTRAGATLRSVGRELGVAQTRACQLHAEAVRMLRESLAG